jgi:hypothetical protein
MDAVDRRVQMTRLKKKLNLKAALDGITDDELKKEPDAEGVLASKLTMGRDGFTTKELTTERAYISGPRGTEAPGFWSRVAQKLHRGAPAETVEGGTV